MSLHLFCPVCNDAFEVEVKCMSYVGGTVDTCGEVRSNMCVTDNCPTCGFTVTADHHYQRTWSETMMEENCHWENEEFEQRRVEYTTTKQVWCRKDAPKLEGQCCYECWKPLTRDEGPTCATCAAEVEA